jgi:hypothetical protein
MSLIVSFIARFARARAEAARRRAVRARFAACVRTADRLGTLTPPLPPAVSAADRLALSRLEALVEDERRRAREWDHIAERVVAL